MPRSNRPRSGPDLRKSRSPELERKNDGGYGSPLGVTTGRESTNPVQRWLGIREDTEASATANLSDILGAKIGGNIDVAKRSGNLDFDLGSVGRGLGIKIGGEITLGPNGLPTSFKAELGASFAGLGGSISADSKGNVGIGIKGSTGILSKEAKIARKSDGELTLTICESVGIGVNLEVCRTISRQKKDPQPVPVTPRPVKPKVTIPKPVKPKNPKLPIAKKRTKPKPKPKPKKPTPVKPPKKPAPIKPKKPVPVPIPKPVKPVKPQPSPKAPKPPRPIPPPKPPAPIKPKRPNPWPRTDPSPINPGVGEPTDKITPLLKNNCLYYVIYFQHGAALKMTYDAPMVKTGEDSYYKKGIWVSTGNLIKQENLPNNHYSPGFIEWHDFPTTNNRAGYGINVQNFCYLAGFGGGAPGEVTGNAAISYSNGSSGYLYDYGSSIKAWINNWVIPGSAWDFSVIQVSCSGNPPNTPAKPLTPIAPPPSPKYNPPRLPNKPTKIKPMDCCAEIKDIYKYLGIAKIKKNKFKVAKAFMVPGGTGNEECEDYYQLQQALFRMLANGLIINPVSKPLGSEWKSVNATAWAGQVYEMTAEAMSNGNSSQKYEISMMMQITQLLTIVAEQSRKIEFLSEALGIEPGLEIEELVACFTIYEGHKGFEKKPPKMIDIAKAKTDAEVEVTLGKMLQPSKIPITKWVLKAESKSIVEILLDQ